MRITKVKLYKQLVLMQRDAQEGYLLYGQQAKKGTESSNNDSITALLEIKKDSFKTSVLNKTLIKKINLDYIFFSEAELKSFDPKQKKEKVKELRSELRAVSQLFEYLLEINKEPDLSTFKNIASDHFIHFLNHRFKQSSLFSYQDKEIQQFDLVKLLTKAQKAKDFNEIKTILGPYRNWVNWFIQRKQQQLAKSIYHNRLAVDKEEEPLPPSPRQQALAAWASELINNNAIALDLSQSFDLSSLLKKCRDTYQQIIIKQQATLAEKNKTFNEIEPIDAEIRFDLHCQLKRHLQSHQKSLLNNIKADQTLNQYSLEVKKYFERYFPVKKSAKRLTYQDYKHYLDLNTVKSVIPCQLKNNVINYIINQGKFLNIGLSPQELNSDILQKNKMKEAFCLKFINACAFAANNLRNGINPQQESDILGVGDLKKSLNVFYFLEKGQVSHLTLSQSQQALAQFFLQRTMDKNNSIQSNLSALTDYFSQPDQYLSFVAAVRYAIQQIRNHVIHYKPDAISQILNIEDFENLKKGNDKIDNNGKRNYSCSYLSELLETEINQLPHFFSEKLKSARLFDFYALNQLETLQNGTLTFTLNPKPLSFIPGFKKVFQWGNKYQQDTNSQLALSHFFIKTPNTEENDCNQAAKDEARYNLLAFIYEQCFTKTFLDNERKKLFSKTVEQVLSANKQRAKTENNKNPDAYAFNGIVSFDDWGNPPNLEKTPENYLKYIQSELIQEENKKRQDGTLHANETGHFQQLIWQLFIKGFDRYLDKNKARFAFVCEPKYQYGDNLINQQKADAQNNHLREFAEKIKIKKEVDSHKNAHIAFWTFCKMLDARHLNELGNQLSKWAQAQQDKHIIEIEIQQEIIALCLLTADRIAPKWQDSYEDVQSALDVLTQYTTLTTEQMQARQSNCLYTQENGDPILFANIELAKRYGTNTILAKLIEKHNDLFKIDFDLCEIDNWKGDNKKVTIFAQQRQTLHQDWIESKAENSQKPSYFFNKTQNCYQQRSGSTWLNTTYQPKDTCDIPKRSQSNGKTYLEICNWLDRYNWLNNKVHLVHIQQLHHLLISILGRLAGFVALFERDFQFLNSFATSENNNYSLDFEKGLPDIVQREWDKQQKKYLPLQSQNDKLIQFYQSTLLVNLVDKHAAGTDRYKKYRNHIAHFNYLTKSTIEYSLLDLLAHTRALVSYDRKLKNAVAKSFIDLLDRQGIEIRFKPLHETNHQFEIASIKAKKITHLGGEKALIDGKPTFIETAQHQQDYIDMVKALLELKDQNKKEQ